MSKLSKATFINNLERKSFSNESSKLNDKTKAEINKLVKTIPVWIMQILFFDVQFNSISKMLILDN